MKDRVHKLHLVYTVEHCPCNVADTLGYEPRYHAELHSIEQGFERHKHNKPHKHIAQCLYAVVFLEIEETCKRTDDGSEPYKDEESPSPIAGVAQGNECYGRITARYVPIDCSMVETAECLLQSRLGLTGMI